jgi:hypothetical protein
VKSYVDAQKALMEAMAKPGAEHKRPARAERRGRRPVRVAKKAAAATA